MKPEIIIHNSVSIDGSLTGFMPDMSLHYRIAGEYRPEASLIGSQTIITGNEMFGNGIPEEVPSDFKEPQRDKGLPWWVVVDSRGRLKGMLHTCRRLEYCRDVIVLVSEKTPDDYIEHLNERKYRYIMAGREKVDLAEALEILGNEYGISRMITDTGMELITVLLTLGLVSEVSLLIHPLVIGGKCYSMFSGLKESKSFTLKRSESYENGCVWAVYSVER